MSIVRRVLAGAILGLTVVAVHAQRGGGPQVPRQAAPFDLTGDWAPLVTEDWRYRMVTPPKGDYASVPLNPAGRKAADSWDPARDQAAGEQCRAFGAGGVMRLPGRIRISWQDDRTLKLETEAGSQVRLLAFGAGAAAGGWQGGSQATWDRPQGPMPGGGIFGGGAGSAAGGSLKVVTTGMKPGYLRRNGVPYSADAVITEYFDRFNLEGGGALLVVSTEIVDPAYLSQPFWTSTHFRRLENAAGWNPTPCSAG